VTLPTPAPASDDAAFLSAVVKAARQRVHHVRWTDRDGTARVSALTAAEFARLEALARTARQSPADVLRAAAFVPVSRNEKT